MELPMVKVPDIYPLQIPDKDQDQGERIIKSIIDVQKLKCQHYLTSIDKNVAFRQMQGGYIYN